MKKIKKIFVIMLLITFIATSSPIVCGGDPPLPDLDVTGLGRVGKTFTGWFENIGDEDIGQFTIHWYVDGDEIEEERKTYPWTLEPGEDDTETEDLSDYIPPGWHYIKFAVNYGSQRKAEVTFSNNYMQKLHYFLF